MGGKVVEFELIPEMKINFTLIPIEGHYTSYTSSTESDIWREVLSKVPGKRESFSIRPDNRDDVEVRPAVEEHGDHGYIIIRGTTLVSLVDRYHHRKKKGKGKGKDWDWDWDAKFDNARRCIINDLNCTFFSCWDLRSHLLVTHFDPSHHPRLFINLLVASQPPPAPPTVLLKCKSWLGPDSRPSLQSFLHSLAKIRVVDISEDKFKGISISIQFQNYQQCYKALKKLCSHSLRKKGGGRALDYQLTLKDDDKSFDYEEVLAYKCSKNSYKAYNESATTKALNNRVSMLEKEFNLVKSLTEESISQCKEDDYFKSKFKGSSKAQALNHRAAMLQKRLDFVKSVMDSRGYGYNNHDESESPSPSSSSHEALALTLRNRVSMLDKELSSLKAVLEDACISRIQALEIRVAMLEKELNAVKDNVVIKKSSHDDDQAQTQALKPCKRLRRE